MTDHASNISQMVVANIVLRNIGCRDPRAQGVRKNGKSPIARPDGELAIDTPLIRHRLLKYPTEIIDGDSRDRQSDQ
jgi:hypothetical protein